ncbi:MAG: dTDP-4-dehydrorhamnose reductase [Flavobacteriales bacterium]
MQTDRKKILITGSNGLLGQKLVKQLVAHLHFQPVATSLGVNRLQSVKNFEYHSLDITDKNAVSQLLGSVKPDVVINTAAMTNVDACEQQREECRKLNVDAVAYLLNACEQINAQFIHLSTDFVFDGAAGPYRETDQPNPLSFYGQSKYDSEQIVLKSSYKNTAIARTIIVFGIVENMSRSNLVLWAKDALSKKQPINVVTDQFRSPTWADDLAKGCILIAEKKAAGIYHISGPETHSIFDLVCQVADFYGLDKTLIKPISSDSLNQPAKRPPLTGFILDKAKQDLGYNPLTFKEALQELDKELASQI